MLKRKTSPSLTTVTHEFLGVNDGGFVWPTPYQEYLKLSAEITNSLVSIIYHSNLSCNLQLGSTSILSVLNMDLIRIGKAAIDFHHASQNNMELVFNAEDYPVSSFIINNYTDNQNDIKSISCFYPQSEKSLSIKRKIIDLARKSKSELDLVFKMRRGRFDLQNECLLLRQHMLDINKNPTNIRPDLWSWKSKNTNHKELNEIVSLIIEEFKKILIKYIESIKIIKKCGYVAQIFVSERLKQGFDKACYIEKLKLKRVAGEVLIGGTPQQIGRLLNWKYQMMDRKVWRFAHGGDRAFYDDIHWGLSELPYCGVYHVHSKGESEALKSRLDRCATYYLPEFKPDVVSIGSLKHQLIWEKTNLNTIKNKNLNNENGIVFIAGSFLGEQNMGPLEFKTPDPLIADTQAWVVNTLKNMDYDISIKVHPGGFYHSLNIQKHWNVPVLMGRFNNEYSKTSVYIFDFAGTAFFDALASDKGIVLLDLKNRPFSKDTLEDLKNRCQIVSARIDEYNRIRFDPDELKNAVDKSMENRECPEWFANKYFN